MFNFGGFFQDAARPFNTSYRCFSVSMFPGPERQDVENGGKIILPPSALEHLTRLNVVYPMLFKLTNSRRERQTHCGVLEFVADEGKCYIPYWMMSNLLMEEGDIIQVESAALPVASYSKFEPQSVQFLDITNPKAVLENALRNFACLTTGDMIAIRYNEKIYELRVLETRPGPGVSIIECDMDVEFASPVDYVEPKPERKVAEEEEPHEDSIIVDADEFIPFTGSGNRLDGKNCDAKGSFGNGASIIRRGVPDFDFKVGTLTFIRTTLNKTNSNKNGKDFKAFGGTGTPLRSKQTKE